jgi:hypothetical protein
VGTLGWSISATLLKLNGTPTSGAVAQLGERLVRNEEATGSIPVSSTISPNISSRIPLLLLRDLGQRCQERLRRSRWSTWPPKIVCRVAFGPYTSRMVWSSVLILDPSRLIPA